MGLSTEKTVITPISQGFDFLGQTIRKYERANGKPAKRQITPSQASFQAIKAKVKTLCQSAAGASPEQRIDTRTPVLRGWANDHRHVICADTFAKLDNDVWQRGYRWAKRRHGGKTGRWIAQRYFPHKAGEAWRFTDPVTGKTLLRVPEVVKAQRHIKGKADATPFDPEWDVYFHYRDKQLTLASTTTFQGKILRQQQGSCPVCRQMIQYDEDFALHHRDGNHRNNRLTNLVLLHPHCHRQVHYAPESYTEGSRPTQGVGHA